MTSQFADHRQIFLSCHVSLVKFRYWFKFHVIIMTGSGVMTTFVYKGFSRKPEIGNTLVSFAQYLDTGASKGNQIWHECL